MNKKLYIETYGCQMNVGDSEVIFSILAKEGYGRTEDISEADVILANTCSVRDNAEQRIWGRLEQFHKQKENRPQVVVGIVGCMAERLKDKILETGKVDLVAGPDSYRTLPVLLRDVAPDKPQINVMLSHEETYADIIPVRTDRNGVSAFISIMRGCNNVCSYCVVPYTRGAERSRDPQTIVREAADVFSKGYREVTLLGQNVDSYLWKSEDGSVTVDFPELLERVAAIRKAMPDCGITTDVIAGFCSETEEDHQDTLKIFSEVGFDYAYMFYYSERPGTLAARHYPDDVSLEVKTRRLNEIIALQNRLSLESNKRDVGKRFTVLVEGPSKKNPEELCGRTGSNKMCVFPDKVHKAGEYAEVEVVSCTSATLICKLAE